MGNVFKLTFEVSRELAAHPKTVISEDALTLQSGSVTFVIKPTGTLKPSSAVLNRQEGSEGPVNFPLAEDGSVAPLALELVAGASGKYMALVKYKAEGSNEEKVEETNAIDVTVLSTIDELDPANQESVKETSIGDYDKFFTYITLALVAVACSAILWTVGTVIRRISLPETVTDDAEVFGTWSERAGSITTLLALGAGMVLLVLGAWLAALETRGRLRLRMTSGGSDKGTPRGADLSASIKALAEVIEKFKTVRGSIAVLIAGTFVVAAACWSVASMASERLAEGTDAATPTSTPSPSDGSSLDRR